MNRTDNAKSPTHTFWGNLKNKLYTKDCIIGILLVALLSFIFFSRFSGLQPDEWKGEIIGFVGDMAIYLLGVIGLFEFSYDNGFTPAVPNWFIEHKEKSAHKQTKQSLQEFFDMESEFLEQHEKERMEDALAIMGLSAQGHKKVRAKLLEARLGAMYDIDTARKRIMDLMFFSDVICDLHKSPDYVNTEHLRYYFKFHDLMHNKQQCDSIVDAMAAFISLTCERNGIDLSEIDVIMVPNSGNYLLGLGVSKRLHKHFIKMIPPERQIGKYSYEGVIPSDIMRRGVNVLIVHDVLLTGGQICESVRDLQESIPNCTIHGLFSAVYRNVDHGREKLKAYNIKSYNLIEMTEEEVEQELKLRGKA